MGECQVIDASFPLLTSPVGFRTSAATCCHSPGRIGSYHQGRRRNIYGYRNIGIRPCAHSRALRSGYLDFRVPYATFRVFAQSCDRDRTQPYCPCWRTRRRTANLPCGIFTEPGEASLSASGARKRASSFARFSRPIVGALGVDFSSASVSASTRTESAVFVAIIRAICDVD